MRPPRPHITFQINSLVGGEERHTVMNAAQTVITKFFPGAEIEFAIDDHPFAVCIEDPWFDGAEITPAIDVLSSFVLKALDNVLQERYGIELLEIAPGPLPEVEHLFDMYENGDLENDEMPVRPVSKAKFGRYMYNATSPLQLIQHDEKMVWAATPHLLERFRRIGYVTPVGVVYYEEFAVGGASFMIIREPGMTDAMMDEAARWLREKRDVVGSIIEAGFIGETEAGVMDLHLPADTLR